MGAEAPGRLDRRDGPAPQRLSLTFYVFILTLSLLHLTRPDFSSSIDLLATLVLCGQISSCSSGAGFTLKLEPDLLLATLNCK